MPANEELDLRDFVLFGATMQYLRYVDAGSPVHEELMILHGLNKLMEYMEKLRLRVSAKSSSYAGLKKFTEILSATDQSYCLTADDANKIKKFMESLQDTIYAELHVKHVHYITEKRIDVEKLSAVKELINPLMYDLLPDVCQYDFAEAGKCIIYERATAAAFHTLRGTEGTLYWFYTGVTGCFRTTEMWHDIVSLLRTADPAPPPELLDHLDTIRENYRNPTQHPEKMYDLEEAQDLFNECIALLNQMMKFLKKIGLF
jgi:hypothetical protein